MAVLSLVEVEHGNANSRLPGVGAGRDPVEEAVAIYELDSATLKACKLYVKHNREIAGAYCDCRGCTDMRAALYAAPPIAKDPEEPARAEETT